MVGGYFQKGLEPLLFELHIHLPNPMPQTSPATNFDFSKMQNACMYMRLAIHTTSTLSQHCFVGVNIIAIYMHKKCGNLRMCSSNNYF